MARQGIGMGRTIWGEARMSATYFNKRGDGHCDTDNNGVCYTCGGYSPARDAGRII